MSPEIQADLEDMKFIIKTVKTPSALRRSEFAIWSVHENHEKDAPLSLSVQSLITQDIDIN